MERAIEFGDPADWRRAVIETKGTNCLNCGAPRASPVPIVPLDRGGRLTPGNAAVLCDTCWRAHDIAPADGPRDGRVSLCMSRELADRLFALVRQDGFGNISAISRWVMNRFLLASDAFEDLGLYQDKGRDARVELRLDAHRLEIFRELVGARGMSINQGFVALLAMYACGDLSGEKT